jgi:general secretion pathway protein K
MSQLRSPTPSLDSPGATRGMALVAVLWTLAALMSAALALTQWVRHEARQRLDDAARLQALAAAQGAMLHVLAHPSAQSPAPRATWRVRVGERELAVTRTSAYHAIDLNRAPADLLQAALRHLGNLPPDQAERWAQSIVQGRDDPALAGRPAYQAVEDLLVRPGLPLSLWLSVQYALTVDSGEAAIDPTAADEPVLLVLAQGDVARAAQWAQARAASAPIDTTSVPAAWLRTGAGDRWRYTVLVPLDDGATFQLTWLVQRRGGAGWPWQLLRQTMRTLLPSITPSASTTAHHGPLG